jgi:hypothetical protein
MKKFTIIGLAICLAFALAAPVMAVDADFSGSYYVRGSYVSHWNLDDRSASNAYMDMRFRLQTVFKVNDILSVTTRFDALDDKVWGDTDETTATSNSTLGWPPPVVRTTTDVNSDIDFDRAYMTIKAPIGTFFIGRQKAFAWGTSFIDSEGEADRIKYVKKIDNLTLIAIFQKSREIDNATGLGDASDQDSDTYYPAFKYKMENITFGALGIFNNNKTVATQTTHVYGLIPYFKSKFGPLAIQGELGYKWGETEYDTAGVTDTDIKKLATTTDVGVLENLGGQSNLSATGNYGAKIIYGGATFSPLENLELGVVVGKADTDELRTGESEDDYGVEYDFTLNWKIYDNLTYSAVAAFLSAGDFYKEQGAIPDANFDDTYALFHQLELSF